METIKQELAEHPLLKGLDPQFLELAAGCASNVVFQPDQFIFREGDPATRFYLIRRGRVQIKTFVPGRGSVTVQTLEDGDVLGWSWLIPSHQYRFDSQAVELTRAIALDGACFRTKCETDHSFGYELLKRFALIVAQRLDAARLQLLDVYGSQD
jgi:CRP-like cAMP-binding protein